MSQRHLAIILESHTERTSPYLKLRLKNVLGRWQQQVDLYNKYGCDALSRNDLEAAERWLHRKQVMEDCIKELEDAL